MFRNPLIAVSLWVPLLITAVTAAEKPKTQIRIIGSSTLSESEVLSKLGGRLDHILLHEATRWRAADAAFLVEQDLQLAGFNDALVKWKLVNNRTIQLRIIEGPRDVLGSITVEDVPNPKLNEALVGLFKLTPQKRATGLSLEHYPIRDEDVDAGISLMEQQMQSIGFYDADITLKTRTDNPETGKVDFVFSVDAGGISMIGAPIFDGQTTPGLHQAIADLIGLPATGPNLNSMRARVVEEFSKAGFLNAKIRMKLEFETLKVRPHFTITEGRRYQLRNITFNGLEKTDPSRISARLEPLKGGILDGPLAQKRIGEIVSTGAFESVRTEFDKSSGDLVDVTLHFKEGKARGISTTVGYDTFEGVILGASYYDRNFRGKLRNFSAGFEISQRSLLGDISLTDPWLWGTDLQGTVRVFALSKDYEGFKSLRSGLGGRINHKVSKHYATEYGAALAYIVNTPDGLLPSDLGDDDYIYAALRFNQMLDYRDNAALPTSGWHIAAPVEVGAVLTKDSSIFARLQLEGSWHYKMSESSQFSVGARGGLLISDGGTNNLPIDQRFFLGGANSVRSFRERELGPWSTTGYPTGGEAYWVTNFEYIRAVAGPLRAVAFVDAGGLTTNWEDLGMSDPEIAVGLGLRINLPIGPARLEYGHNLTRDGRDPSGTWHFAIGATF